MEAIKEGAMWTTRWLSCWSFTQLFPTLIYCQHVRLQVIFFNATTLVAWLSADLNDPRIYSLSHWYIQSPQGSYKACFDDMMISQCSVKTVMHKGKSCCYEQNQYLDIDLSVWKFLRKSQTTSWTARNITTQVTTTRHVCQNIWEYCASHSYDFL